jgi:hypothetical protein
MRSGILLCVNNLYYLPYHPDFDFFRFNNVYFCTERDFLPCQKKPSSVSAVCVLFTALFR